MSKKVKVRIALRIDEDGGYVACGDDTLSDEDLVSNTDYRPSRQTKVYWIETEVEPPKAQVIAVEAKEVEQCL